VKRTNVIYFLFITTLVYTGSLAQQISNEPVFIQPEMRWADSVFKKMTPEERIAQLFMVAAYSDRKKQKPEEIKKLIKKYKIGGLIFFQGGPVRQAILTNYYQSLSRVPLLISIDGEWGLAMRLDSTVQFPRQMTLGAIQDDSMIYEMGRIIARQCKRMGIHVNLAPVVDVNNNPMNPVISNRSFGEDKYNVAKKGLMYMKGLQDEKILACAKHFPGHGDTESDSHKTLPVINSDRERMDTLELYPFKKLINEGLGGMMVAHLFIPAYDSTANQASTLSKNIVTDLLKGQLQFKGLVFTDALNMKGVSKFYKPGEVDVKALLAGNDVLLFSEDVPKAIAEIKKAIERGEITQDEIDSRCKKILYAKQWVGLDHYEPVKIKKLYEDIHTPQADLINRKLIENSLTLLQNKNDLVPLKNLDTLKIASLSIGYRQLNTFQEMLGNYAPVKHFGIDKEEKKEKIDSVLNALKEFNLVIIEINNTNNIPAKNFGLTPQSVNAVKAVMKDHKVILTVLANPYVLSKFDSIQYVDAIVMSYEDTELSESLSAQLIFGGIQSKGKLPVTASSYFKVGTGVQSSLPIRLKYTIPEELNIDSKRLAKIDSIALRGIKEKAYPGCQVFVAKEGKVIYRKSFGYYTYGKNNPVRNDDLYDLASITKIAASTPAIMKLVDEHKIDIDGTLGTYLPFLKESNKEKIVIREVLTHQAGLKDWIPFYLRTLDKKGGYKPGIYSTTQSDSFPYRVAENLYICKSYPDTMMKRIIDSPVSDKHQYKYSDLGYYLMQKIIESKTQVSLNEYVRKNFYNPLGLSTMGYRPRERFALDRIAPTENDTKFRKQLVQGDVHDYGAAMLGGVGGHAGVFSDANDLGVLMQMYMQQGEYGGKRYIDSAIVKEFTKCQYCKSSGNRRGIGFDKPAETGSGKENPVCDCVSYLSFGHSGFTGTLAWADPEKQLVYIFLSNRVYPDVESNKLLKLGIRTAIQEVIYDAIK